VREIFDVYASVTGVTFRESTSGARIAKGDLRAADPGAVNGREALPVRWWGRSRAGCIRGLDERRVGR